METRLPFILPTRGKKNAVKDSHGGLAYCNSWGRKESDTTE